MKTECTLQQLRFQASGKREIRASFDGGHISSDGGALLLREVEKRAGIIERFSQCLEDHRNPDLIEHKAEDLLAQRVYGIALGYEDLNDHDDLRKDPLLAVLVGKDDPLGQRRHRKRDVGNALAGKSTLNRLELSRPESAAQHRYKRIVVHQEQVDQAFIDLFLESYSTPPEQIILDVDATDDPLHGEQEGRFFHGYYNCYCYLPLYIFAGEHLLCSRLRPSNRDAAAGTLDELKRIIAQIRKSWPEVEILVRGDSGFCRDEIMTWCEENMVDFLFGLARNPRLEKRLAASMATAKELCLSTKKAARIFEHFCYRTKKSWSRARRVVGKAEYLRKGPNPRFVVTSLPRVEVDDQKLYEEIYCARGDMENRIKEQQLYLFADRTSSHEFLANQARLYFSSMAYVLVSALRRLGLDGTDFESAQCSTIRLKLLKIGAQIRITVRKVWISLSESYPYARQFKLALANLGASPPG